MGKRWLVLIPVLIVGLWFGLGIGFTRGGEGATETITIPRLSLSGFTIYELEQKLSDPRAQSPEYVYLVSGEEAVKINSLEISGAEYFFLDNEEIIEVDHGYFEDYEASGYEVKVNSHLVYTIAIHDFEQEVDLAQVELRKEGDAIKSSFIFIASGDGVAHDVTITALLDGATIGSTSPISIEVRSGEEGIQVSLKRITDEQEIKLEGGELEIIPFTDFAFIVNFNSPIKPGDQENTVVVYREFWKEWANTTIKVYAQEGTVVGARADFFFPEDDPANEVDVETEIVDKDCIVVSPASGSFPSGSQIVLVLDFGEFAPPKLPPCREGYVERVFTQ